MKDSVNLFINIVLSLIVVGLIMFGGIRSGMEPVLFVSSALSGMLIFGNIVGVVQYIKRNVSDRVHS